MSKHTPGPWIIWPDMNGRLQVGSSTNYSVAEMWRTPLEGQEANARLIAAAPDLLEALETWLEQYSSEEYEDCPEVVQTRAAIAKATGEKT